MASDRDEMSDVLEKMRRDWEQRASQNAAHYVWTRDSDADEATFDDSARVNYDQLVRPYLPVLLRGRSPKRCRVLEIGCGVGRMTRFFAEEFLAVHGIDISSEMIRQAKERLDRYPNVFLQLGLGKDLGGLADNFFDLAFSYLVFQHIPSGAVIENYVREAARVLKPGGAFLFQLNGHHAPEYQNREKDTWQGHSFSLTQAVRMLHRAGLSPLAATGVNTQYLVIASRKTEQEALALSSYILPGQGWAEGQFREGWLEPIPGDCRPMDSCCRTILAVPPGSGLRAFISFSFAPAEPKGPITLTAKLDESSLGSVTVEQKGDYYFEWPVPSAIVPGSRAELTLEIEPPGDHGIPGIRSLGIYACREPDQAQQPRQRELEERAMWARELQAQLEASERTVQELQADLEAKVAWAHSLERDVEQARNAFARAEGELQSAHQERDFLARELQAQTEASGRVVRELQGEVEAKVAWARSLEQDVEQARNAFARAEGELQSAHTDLQSLHVQLDALRADLRLLADSRWHRLGRKLRWSPVTGSEGNEKPPS